MMMRPPAYMIIVIYKCARVAGATRRRERQVRGGPVRGLAGAIQFRVGVFAGRPDGGRDLLNRTR